MAGARAEEEEEELCPLSLLLQFPPADDPKGDELLGALLPGHEPSQAGSSLSPAERAAALLGYGNNVTVVPNTHVKQG